MIHLSEKQGRLWERGFKRTRKSKSEQTVDRNLARITAQIDRIYKPQPKTKCTIIERDGGTIEKWTL